MTENKNFTKELSEDTIQAIQNLVSYSYYGEIQQIEDTVILETEGNRAFGYNLILYNASGVPKEDYDYLYIEQASLDEQGEYSISGTTAHYDNDTEVPFSICFTGAEMKMQSYCAGQEGIGETPWMYLITVASEIVRKAVLSENSLNEYELELLPLFIELSKIFYCLNLPAEWNTEEFPNLRKYIKKYGYKELLPYVDKLEACFGDLKKQNKAAWKWLSVLNRKKYVPLWREIYNALLESQKPYSTRVEVFLDSKDTQDIRGSIQQMFEEEGYTGIYPDFMKRGELRGIHLKESYGMSYFVGREKNVISHIHCCEDILCEELRITFLCGTELLQEGEQPGDIYDCLFDAKGHSFWNSVFYGEGYRILFEELGAHDLEKRVKLATKVAELQKLTKQERKEFLPYDIPWWKIFLPVFLIGGGLYGLAMTVGFMIIEVIHSCVVGQPQVISEVFMDTSWWNILLFCWVSFGGTTGIITVLITVLASGGAFIGRKSARRKVFHSE